MDRQEFLALGAGCMQRMSLRCQQALCRAALAEEAVPSRVADACAEIEGGEAFLAACGGAIDRETLVSILGRCDRATIERIVGDLEMYRAFLGRPEVGGHYVLGNEAIYYTPDMDATMAWFEKVFGWKGVVDVRDANGKGSYGYVTMGETYLQMMRGAPLPLAAFMKVWGIRGLRELALRHGCDGVTGIEDTDWGAKLFSLKSCDGCELRFFQPGFYGFTREADL